MGELEIKEFVSRYLARTGFAEFSPKAALIDMDGTLLDTMKGHTLAWQRMVSELGIGCTREEFYLYEGMTGAATINLLFQRAFGREATPQERTELYARKTGYFNELPRAEIVKGADRMVNAFMEHGIVRVLVTGSGQLSNLARLDVDFPGAFPHDMRITSHDVVHGKPHPEPFLKAMSLAGVQPFESIAMENAPLGGKSASDAGAFTIAVTTGPIPEQQLWDAGADMVLRSMDEAADMLSVLLTMYAPGS